MLRHADIGTTLDIYTHAINRDKLVAQNRGRPARLNAVGVGDSYELCRVVEARDVCKRNLALRAVSLTSGSG